VGKCRVRRALRLLNEGVADDDSEDRET
jgi:hypothetical protein